MIQSIADSSPMYCIPKEHIPGNDILTTFIRLLRTPCTLEDLQAFLPTILDHEPSRKVLFSREAANTICHCFYNAPLEIFTFLLTTLDLTYDVDYDVFLIRAAERGRIDVIRYIVEVLKYPVPSTMTIFTGMAMVFKQFDVVKYFIENVGIDIYSDGGSTLADAAYVGRLDMVEYLFHDVEAGKEYGTKAALVTSIERGHLHIMKYFIETMGVQVGVEVLYESLEYARRHTFKYAIDAIRQRSLQEGKEIVIDVNDLFIKAVRYENLEIVKLLVEEMGADVHVNGDQALRSAIRNDDEEMILYLIGENRIDPGAHMMEILRWVFGVTGGNIPV